MIKHHSQVFQKKLNFCASVTKLPLIMFGKVFEGDWLNL